MGVNWRLSRYLEILVDWTVVAKMLKWAVLRIRQGSCERMGYCELPERVSWRPLWARRSEVRDYSGDSAVTRGEAVGEELRYSGVRL